ncbi:MAG TPA: hypothetical protein VFM51_02970 [Solirubrobacterales bacterium]|nr:hypothetical protein [Solirubrobacterales bacterium]
MEWPPRVGELLPRADEAIGVREKLATYSLDQHHRHGGPKARGFALILGITLESIDHLEGEIRRGVVCSPVTAVLHESSAVKCVVEFPIRGLGAYERRIVNLRTVWRFSQASAPPRLLTAFLKP